MPCLQPFRGDTSQMLLFKIASCLEASGAAGGGVTSFNGFTGAILGVSSFNSQIGDVVLTLADISTLADGRYVLKTGDTMTGALVHPDGTAALPSITFTGDLDTGIYRIGANSLGITTGGVVKWLVNASGHINAGADNTYDIGAGGLGRPRDLYFVGRLLRNSTDIWDLNGIQIASAAFFYWNGRSALNSPSDSIIRISNNAGTDFNRLQFGGTTSAFPSIKRSAATLQFRLADDSAFAGIATAGIDMSAGAPLTISSGANQRAGDVVLVAGTVTTANTTVTANTRVYTSRKTAGGVIGNLTYTVIAATSFTITSDNVADTSTVSYLLIGVP